MPNGRKVKRRVAEHATAVRLTDLDMERIRRIVEAGRADSTSGAIRWALRFADEKVAA